MKLRKSLLALVLAMVLIVSLVACQEKEPVEEESSEESSESSVSESQIPEPESNAVGDRMPDFREFIEEKHEQNEDTIGWVQMPGTLIDDVVVFRPEEADNEMNDYYLKLDFDGNYDRTGTYYADITATFGDGTRDGLGVNTCIFGHALTDDDENDNYSVKFGTLHNLRDPEQAKEIPYINFSTAQENMTFEVIAVFTANANNPDFPYNMNSDDPAAFIKMVEEEVFPRSIYDYGVELKETDKFLTLSTCIYYLPDEARTFTNYPNTYMRYAVMARLVDPDAEFKEEVEFTINENLHVDNDGPTGYYSPQAAA